MWEVHIVQQKQDGVQGVVFFGLAFLPRTEVETTGEESKHQW